jgi:hypothetical protein
MAFLLLCSKYPRREVIMWNWFNCHVSGRHEYGVSCETGAIFLRCVHCSHRSAGWSVDAKALIPFRPESHRVKVDRRPPEAPVVPAAPVAALPTRTARILPFVREERCERDQRDLRQAG